MSPNNSGQKLGGLDLGRGRQQPARSNWIFLKRGIAFSVSGVLGVLILTSALPPLVADQSDRAVVNAPVTLLTAPINGDVQSLDAEPGQQMNAGRQVADLVNDRVDRSTLITLEGQANDNREELRAVYARRESDTGYLKDLTDEIGKQTTAILARYQAQVADLQARMNAAAAATEEKKQIYGYQANLVQHDVASPQMVKTTSQQYAGAKFKQDSTQANLVEKQAELDSARKGIFVGDDVHDLAVLIQKKRDMELDVQRLDIQAARLEAAIRSHTKLLDAERERLERLSHSGVVASGAGEIISVSASVGRHVNAGDTLARMVDCKALFVVAIFSYRQGSDLAPGGRVSIDAGQDGTLGGTITEVLPKTSDKVDEAYALPFPQTERRELYVLIRPDQPLRRATADGHDGQCDIGRWVTITRDGGWIPSSSVMWRGAGGQLVSTIEKTVNAVPLAFSVIGNTIVEKAEAALRKTPALKGA